MTSRPLIAGVVASIGAFALALSSPLLTTAAWTDTVTFAGQITAAVPEDPTTDAEAGLDGLGVPDDALHLEVPAGETLAGVEIDSSQPQSEGQDSPSQPAAPGDPGNSDVTADPVESADHIEPENPIDLEDATEPEDATGPEDATEPEDPVAPEGAAIETAESDLDTEPIDPASAEPDLGDDGRAVVGPDIVAVPASEDTSETVEEDDEDDEEGDLSAESSDAG